MRKIIVIEDEQSIADTIIHSIEKEGFTAVWRAHGLEGLALIKSEVYDLLVLDVGLPDISGFELCKAIRAFSDIPIIFLTARSDEIDRIVGLEIGGDDYVTKPFSPRELGARIKTILRRVAPPATSSPAPESRPEPEVLSPLRIDEDKMQVLYHGKRLELTRYEFKLLALLAASPGRVYSREALMEKVWDDDSPSLDRTVDAHIKSLRAKCREVAPEVDPILTHRGTGYALRDDL